MYYQEMLKGIGAQIPSMVEWPKDLTSLMETGEVLKVTSGVVYPAFLSKGKIAFSTMISKGKPPERRTAAMMFDPSNYRAVLIQSEKVGSQNMYRLYSRKGIFLVGNEEVISRLEDLIQISETTPAWSYLKDPRPQSTELGMDSSGNDSQISAVIGLS